MSNVLFKRGDTATINGTAITDGQLLYDTTTGQHYIDSGSTRIEVGKPVVNTTAEVNAITADNIPCGTKPVKELNQSLAGISMRKGTITVTTDSNGRFTFTDIVNSNTKNICFNTIDRTLVIYCRIDDASGIAKDNNNVAFANTSFALNYVAFDWN